MSEGEIRFSREHEWLVMKEGIATMGIVDSVKASSDIYSAITGEVIEVNEELLEHPELVNQSPQDSGWIVKIKPSDLQEFELLMSKDEYNSFVGEAESSKKRLYRKKDTSDG